MTVALELGAADSTSPGVTRYSSVIASPSEPLEPEAALSEVLGKTKGTLVRGVRFEDTRPNVASTAGWARIEMSASNPDEPGRDRWEADLVAGQLAEAGRHRDQSANLPGYTIVVERQDGSVSEEEASVGVVARGQVFSDAGSRSDETIRAELELGLHRFGLELVYFDMARFGTGAPVVVVRTSDRLAGAARIGEAIQATMFSDGEPLYEGYYFRMVDSSNEQVAINTTSFRTGVGRFGVAPDVDGKTGGIVHG